MAEPNRLAAVTLLAQMLTGIPHTGGPDDATFSLDDLDDEGENMVSTKVTVGSGDVYRVSVQWLQGESP